MAYSYRHRVCRACGRNRKLHLFRRVWRGRMWTCKDCESTARAETRVALARDLARMRAREEPEATCDIYAAELAAYRARQRGKSDAYLGSRS